MSFEIVKGDLEPDMQLQATVNDVPEPLTGAQSHDLRWMKPGGTVTSVALTAVDLTLGKVKRIWSAGDTDVVGIHRGQIVVVRANGEVQTFPSDGSWFYWFVNPPLEGEASVGNSGVTSLQSFRYTATGSEGSDFMINLPATRAGDNYRIAYSLGSVAAIVGLAFPDTAAGDRTNTQFRIQTSANLTAGDQIDLLVFDAT